MGAIKPATAGKGKTVPVARTTYGNNDLNRIDAAFRRRLQFPKQNESINESRAVALVRLGCPPGGGFNRGDPSLWDLTV